jgi:prepilin-type N-terminal cleavage/methylation domain-containing protein
MIAGMSQSSAGAKALLGMTRITTPPPSKMHLMKTQHTPTQTTTPFHQSSGFTLIELLTVVSIIAILSAATFPGIKAAMRNAQINAATQNAKQVATGLRNLAADYDGAFPGTIHPDTEEEFTNANEVFRILFPEYIDTERVFTVAGSAWGAKADGRFDEESDCLQAGENHWAYIAGLTTTSRSDWPLIVDGTNGSGTYSSEPGTKGGTWEGRKTIVVRVGGSAESVRLMGDEQARYLPRYGYPEENALEVNAYMGEGAVFFDPEA